MENLFLHSQLKAKDFIIKQMGLTGFDDEFVSRVSMPGVGGTS